MGGLSGLQPVCEYELKAETSTGIHDHGSCACPSFFHVGVLRSCLMSIFSVSSRLTPVRLTFGVPRIQLHVSPAVYARAMNILDSMAKKLDISSSNRMDLPEEITYEVSIKLLTWEGIGRSNPVWKMHRLILMRDRLCVCKTKDIKDVVRWTRLGEDVQLIPLAREDALGKANVVAVSSSSADSSTLALEDSRSVILCMTNQAEKGQFLHAVELAKRKLAMLTNGKNLPLAMPKPSQKMFCILVA